MQPCCQLQARLSPSSIQRSPSAVSTMPTLDHVVGARRAVLEIDLHAEHVAAVRVELELVVVAEPVELRALRNGAGRGQATRLRRDGGSGEELSAGHENTQFIMVGSAVPA